VLERFDVVNEMKSEGWTREKKVKEDEGRGKRERPERKDEKKKGER
jgi:hypothetical protein